MRGTGREAMAGGRDTAVGRWKLCRGAAKRGAAGREGAAKCGCGIGRGAMAGRCGAAAGWNAGAAGRAIAGAAGRAIAAGAAPGLGCCAEAPILPAIRERPTKEAAKGSAKPTLSGSMVVSSLSYPAPHASLTRERGKRSTHERRAGIIAALQDGLVRTPRLIAIAQVHDLDCDQGNVRSGSKTEKLNASICFPL